MHKIKTSRLDHILGIATTLMLCTLTVSVGESKHYPDNPRYNFGDDYYVYHSFPGEKKTKHRIEYQENAGKLVINGVAGFPFPLIKLETNKAVRLRPTLIIIDELKHGNLIPSSTSAVPVNLQSMQSGGEIGYYANAVNVTWKFLKPGILFQAGDVFILTIKSNATVRFLETGVEVDGVEEFPDIDSAEIRRKSLK